MDVITRILFGSHKGVNVLGHDWDHLIVLDACRCDVFEHVYRRVFPKAAEFKCIMYFASSIAEKESNGSHGQLPKGKTEKYSLS